MVLGGGGQVEKLFKTETKPHKSPEEKRCTSEAAMASPSNEAFLVSQAVQRTCPAPRYCLVGAGPSLSATHQ